MKSNCHGRLLVRRGIFVGNCEFIEKLVAITPAPRSHLVRWGGVFAYLMRLPYRKKIVLRPEVSKGFRFEKDETSSEIDTEIDKENLKENLKKAAGRGCYQSVWCRRIKV